MSSNHPDLQRVYQKWSDNRTPENMSVLLRALDPMLKSVSGTHGVQGDQNVTWAARAYLAKQIIERYDPSKTNISTFTYQTLQRIPRIAAQQRNVVKVPETSDYDMRRLRGAKEDLYDQLNREPNDDELADYTGIDVARIKNLDRRFSRPIMAASHAEELTGSPAGGNIFDAPEENAETRLWREYSMDALDPIDKKIHKWMTAPKPISKVEIAGRLGMSPSAVTQRTARISKELAEFGG